MAIGKDARRAERASLVESVRLTAAGATALAARHRDWRAFARGMQAVLGQGVMGELA